MEVGVVSQRVLYRKALCSLLAGANIFTSVIELASVSDTVDSSDESQTLVLVVNATEPGTGIESVHQLRNLLPQARAVLLADHLDEVFCAGALEAGAWGCLSTTDSPQVLVKAITKVFEGERWFSHRVTNKVVEKLLAQQEEETNLIEALTPREWEVLALLAKGHSDKEIASLLFISRETAHSHVKSIYRKLQVSTRGAAAVCYFKNLREGSPSLKKASPATAPEIA